MIKPHAKFKSTLYQTFLNRSEYFLIESKHDKNDIPHLIFMFKKKWSKSKRKFNLKELNVQMNMTKLTCAIGQCVTFSQTPVWFRFCTDCDDFAQAVLDEMVTFE